MTEGRGYERLKALSSVKDIGAITYYFISGASSITGVS